MIEYGPVVDLQLERGEAGHVAMLKQGKEQVEFVITDGENN